MTAYVAQVGDTLVLVQHTDRGHHLVATKPAYDPYATWSPPVLAQVQREWTAVQLDGEDAVDLDARLAPYAGGGVA